MEMLHFRKSLFQLCLLLTLHFSSLLLLSSANSTVPDKYFINCGASSDASFYNGQVVFVADSNSKSPYFSTGKSEQVSDTSASTQELLYQTARVYRQPCSYSFEIGQNGTYIVRLHFFAYLSSPANLYDALFNVSASGFSLFTNFSIRNSSSFPVIKEYLLTIPQGKFRIQFIPSQDSSLAFVNAIEVFLANETRIIDYAPHVSSARNVSNYTGLLSQALHTIHRINFGGSQIDYDELWRKWVADDSYFILHSDSAKNSTPYNRVYQTAKQLKTGANGNASLLNLTWSFPVITKTLNDILFNLYIYSNFDQLIDPYNRTGDFAVPFFIDYVVDSDDSGFTNFSICPSENDSRILNAFLNGLEIMEFMNKSGSIVDECGPVTDKKHFPVIKIIVSVSSGAFVILIIVLVLRLKYRKAVPDQSLTGLLFGGISFNRIPIEEDDHEPTGGDDDSDSTASELQFHKIHLPPFAALLFLLQFLSVAYSLTDNYFINCGSATNANTDFRNFVGDLNSSDSISSSFSFTGQSSALTNSNPSSGTSSTLYQTARIFRSNSSYEFDIPNNVIYFVRLHFFAFSTPTDLSTALFDVWTSGSSLLLNFTGKNSSNFPIKEFFLPISPGKFNVYFLPRGSSFAFINAIEVFPANDSYIPDEAKQIRSAGSNNTYRGLRSWTLQTIYRINVGGPKITPENDTLWRN
ncbi:putative receptor-like protein kinase [Quercus suber]|uniref:Receptor-like protein kinase n=1 Tax=Quercus suber TaxID=58331 RepID=A0AAW0LMR6_QUESU